MIFLLALGSLSVSSLDIQQVLQSAMETHPEIRAADFKRTGARGELTSALGAFDLQLEATGGTDTAGYYDKLNGELSLTQQLQTLGTKLNAGYRYGEDYPSYDGDRVTSFRGEVFAGLALPLLRDRSIDKRRLALRLRELDVSVADLGLRSKQIAVLGKSAEVYWKWLGAGQRTHIFERLLEIARTRQTAVQNQVALGNRAHIEADDNRRLVLTREQQVIEARRVRRTEALRLSLFHRDEQGRPVAPGEVMLPDAFPEPPTIRDEALERDMAAIDQLRPELMVFGRLLDAVRLQQEMARNDLAPSADLKVEGSRDFGARQPYDTASSQVSRNETELKLGLTFRLPVQRREARGKLNKMNAEQARLQAEQGFLREQVEVQVRDAFQAWQRAYARVELGQEALELALKVERAERRKFELGQSNILFVNAREDFSADTASKYFKALEECHRAYWMYLTATGRIVSLVTPTLR